MQKSKEDYRIKSVSHALDLLEVLTGNEGELGVTEIGKRLGLQKNNVFRLLATLETRGYVEQNKLTENYRLGLKPLELGKALLRHCALTTQCKEVLRNLVSRCNETVSLGVFRGGRVIYIDVEETTESVRVVSRLGAALPLYCTSIGKVLLAFREQDEIMAFLKETPLVAFTEKTVTDWEALNHQVSLIRRQGYALDDEEYELSVKCIAVPIRDHSGSVVAGLSLSGPAHRLPPSRLTEELIPALMNAGQELSKRLGYDVHGVEE